MELKIPVPGHLLGLLQILLDTIVLAGKQDKP